MYHRDVPRIATLSTTIDPAVKRALARYARQRGLTLRFVVEQAIVDLIEDEADLAAWRQRRDEPAVAWAEVLKAHRKATAE